MLRKDKNGNWINTKPLTKKEQQKRLEQKRAKTPPAKNGNDWDLLDDIELRRFKKKQ